MKDITNDKKLKRLYQNYENSLVKWKKEKSFDTYDAIKAFYLGQYLINTYSLEELVKYGGIYDVHGSEYTIGYTLFKGLKNYYGRFTEDEDIKEIYG